jgi:PTS system nitrogen regulatory IIA component
LLDLQEAAHLLHVSSATLVRWVRQGLVIAADTERMRFERHELERWARRRGLSLSHVQRPAAQAVEDLLASAMARGAVIADARPTTALQAIEVAVHAVPGLDEAARTALLEQVLERERMASTGLGAGVAVPHPRKPSRQWCLQPIVNLVFLEEPLDWAALDDRPVHTVFLLLSPDAHAHLEILSRVAYVLRMPEFPFQHVAERWDSLTGTSAVT